MWVHGDFAYVGSWAAPCGLGVRIVDVSDPASPETVATAAAYDATSAEDVEVLSVDTPSFTGDLMGVGLQDCGSGLAGLDLWDVTDPANPLWKGFYPNFGVHELSLTARTDGVLALLASPFSEPFTFFFDPPAIGDFQLVEVTDPANPVLTDDWGALKDEGFPAGAPGIPAPYDCDDPLCRGSDPAIFAHSASPSADGMTAYIAYWDLGESSSTSPTRETSSTSAARSTRQGARATRTPPWRTGTDPCWRPPTRTSPRLLAPPARCPGTRGPSRGSGTSRTRLIRST